jgi:hypothetical protein
MCNFYWFPPCFVTSGHRVSTYIKPVKVSFTVWLTSYDYEPRLTPELDIIYYGTYCSTPIKMQYWLFLLSVSYKHWSTLHTEQISFNSGGTNTHHFSPEGLWRCYSTLRIIGFIYLQTTHKHSCTLRLLFHFNQSSLDYHISFCTNPNTAL